MMFFKVISPFGIGCNKGQAYHSGELFEDYSTVVNAEQCLDKCNSAAACKFWDFGEGWCRLRTNSGNGPQVDNRYTSGPKYCIFNMGNRIFNYIVLFNNGPFA